MGESNKMVKQEDIVQAKQVPFKKMKAQTEAKRKGTCARTNEIPGHESQEG